jgi:L-lactate dehydrogenase
MKVGVVGSGFVGSTAAYALVMRGIGREIVLLDKNEKRAKAEAEDILHAVPYAHPLKVRAGDYPDLTGSGVVIIAAGVSQKSGETRLDLLKRNAAVFEEVVPNILTHAPEAVLLVATNPVDIMTHLAAHYARSRGTPPSRVVGSGTLLDTARFRSLLGAHLGVDSYHVHGYVVGEHGDSEVLTWSIVRVGAITLGEYCRLRGIECREKEQEIIDNNVRRAAYHIIDGKGSTYYGIGGALAHIVDVVLHDQRSVLTVCTPLDEVEGIHGVTVSLPHLISGDGNLGTFPLSLDESETAALRSSAQIVKEAIESLGVSE